MFSMEYHTSILGNLSKVLKWRLIENRPRTNMWENNIGYMEWEGRKRKRYLIKSRMRVAAYCAACSATFRFIASTSTLVDALLWSDSLLERRGTSKDTWVMVGVHKSHQGKVEWGY
jgi:hypothetical protein